LRYRARSTISTTRQRLSFDRGRVSAIRTVSPVLAVFSSSCALTRLVRVTILPYTGCGTRRSIATTTVFCILSLTTRPVRVLRVARVSAPVVLVISAIGQSLLSPARRAGTRRRARSLLALYRLQPRQVPANHPQPQRIVQRLRRAPELEAELLLLELANPSLNVVRRHLANFVSPHWSAPPRVPRTSSAPASSRPPAPSPFRRCRA